MRSFCTQQDFSVSALMSDKNFFFILYEVNFIIDLNVQIIWNKNEIKFNHFKFNIIFNN